MKKTKVIIPALAVLLLSTAASVTGTVAWFAMNSTVAATGMQIKVNSQNTYLLISGTNTTASAIQSENSTSAALTVTAEQALVQPSHPVSNAEQAALLNTTNGKDVSGATITTAGAIVEDAATAAEFTNWYTAVAAATDAPTMLEGSARQLTAFTGYVVVRHAYLTVAVGSNPVGNLKITSSITPKGLSASSDTQASASKSYYSYTTGVYTNLNLAENAEVPEGSFEYASASGPAKVDMRAIKLMVATNDGAFDILDYADNDVETDIKGSNNSITSSIVRIVDLYLYVDGENAAVYTNNALNLADADVSLSFSAVQA